MYSKSSVELRDYQDKVLKQVLSKTVLDTWWPRGILHLPVGAGKTEIAVAIYQTIPAKTLVLQNKKDLVIQTENRFIKYGITPGVFGVNRHETDKQITIATVQSVLAAWKRNHKKTKTWLESFEQVFVDEAHELLSAKNTRGNTGVRILNRLPNAFFRWALSATAFDRDLYSAMTLKSVIGSVSSMIEMNDLISQGHLSDLDIKLVEFKHDIFTPLTWPECLDQGVVANPRRNKLIIDEITKLPKPVLVMTPRVEHAYKLSDLVNNAGMLSVALTQEQSILERTNAITDLRSGKLHVIVATTIFDQGVDIPELRAILLAAGGKSRVRAIQRIGRVLRKANGKHRAIMVDIIDRSNKILRRHATARLKIWKELGFNILK